MSIQYNYLDVKLTDDGDISFSNGDFDMCSSAEAFAQHMKTRILTNKGEIPMHKSIGSDLEELEGMANSRETGSYGTSKIVSSLRTEPRVDPSQVSVRAVPTAKDEITFYTFAEIDNSLITNKTFIPTTFSLSKGIFIKK